MSEAARPEAPITARQAISRAWAFVVSNGRRFGAYFFLTAMTLVLAFLVYMQVFVVQPVRDDARRMIELYAFFTRIATQDTIFVAQSSADLNIIFETIRDSNFPVVITDTEGVPQYWKGIGVPPEDHDPGTHDRVRDVVKRLNLQNDPLTFEIPQIGTRVLHYGDSDLVRRLSWLPLTALLVAALLIGVGYSGFLHIKNSEQRSIWVGMARETAHQLGTPLSSLSGWTELLKAEIETGRDREDLVRRLEQVTREMEQDTSRLNKIASRFSQIGSIPELRVGDLGDAIADTAAYLRTRLPSEVRFDVLVGDVPPIPMNRELLGWAFENLFKNAADAIEGRADGRIEVDAKLREEGEWVDVTVRDNGKGIEPHNVKQVFIPGYSTKKRGWGLGLAFVKRIVEDYHKGRITIAETVPGKGTTFLISLPAQGERV